LQSLTVESTCSKYFNWNWLFNTHYRRFNNKFLIKSKTYLHSIYKTLTSSLNLNLEWLSIPTCKNTQSCRKIISNTWINTKLYCKLQTYTPMNILQSISLSLSNLKCNIALNIVFLIWQLLISQVITKKCWMTLQF